METKTYFTALGKHYQLPIGLKAYLSRALKAYPFEKRQRITSKNPDQNYLSCIQSGAARLYSTDKETREEQSLDFFFEGDFIPLIHQATLREGNSLSIEFLEDTTTLAISEKHYLFLPKIFPQTIHLYHNIQQKHYLNQIEQNILRKTLSAQERYQQLQTLRPELSNRISITDMASFLGIHPNTLSALRGKK